MTTSGYKELDTLYKLYSKYCSYMSSKEREKLRPELFIQALKAYDQVTERDSSSIIKSLFKKLDEELHKNEKLQEYLKSRTLGFEDVFFFDKKVGRDSCMSIKYFLEIPNYHYKYGPPPGYCDALTIYLIVSKKKEKCKLIFDSFELLTKIEINDDIDYDYCLKLYGSKQ